MLRAVDNIKKIDLKEIKIALLSPAWEKDVIQVKNHITDNEKDQKLMAELLIGINENKELCEDLTRSEEHTSELQSH